jgi:hypothetical protein
MRHAGSWLTATVALVTLQSQEGSSSAACAAPVVVALLDDEPHANLDKRRHLLANSNTADAPASAKAGGDRAVGVATAVAERLEVVLALCAVNGGGALAHP